jgi:DNA-binding LacI/PurR family transcriptional regulator
MDIAARLGFSQTFISRVITRDPRVDHANAEAVWSEIERVLGDGVPA